MSAATENVFINCPFDDGFKKLFEALVFTVYSCGFRPRSARELDDSGEVRIEKLFRIIGECRYGIHDLSRTQLDKNRLPRFNMPLELGIFLGARRFGSAAQKGKRTLIFDCEKYRYQKFVSDLAGMDPRAHANNETRIIAETRNWLTNVSRRPLPSGKRLVAIYKAFRKELPTLVSAVGLHQHKLEYVDYERFVVGWLIGKRP